MEILHFKVIKNDDQGRGRDPKVSILCISHRVKAKPEQNRAILLTINAFTQALKIDRNKTTRFF